jgi:2-polyprenyl-3-methyl-5-hydroxy-6-metoxy-1,4-benzoquinol methylase
MHYTNPNQTDDADVTYQINQLYKKCYDNRAYVWDRFPFPDILPKWVTQHFPQSNGIRVLDVGSGTGLFAKWLQNQGFDVTCIDPSDEMVRRCRKQGLKILQSNLQEYHTQQQFGMVVAILSLIHIPKKDFADQIKKIHSMLAPGGILLLAMIEGNGESIEDDISGYPRFFSYFTPDEIRKMFNPTFQELNFTSVGSGSIHYILFAFEKKI